MPLSPTDDPIAFAERVLQVLDEGRVVTSYKYAVMLALIDLAASKTGPAGEPPKGLTTREIAEKVIELYWPQVDVFTGGTTATVLRQLNNRNESAGIITAVSQLRHALAGVPTTTKARLTLPDLWEKTASAVEWVLVQQPLPRLQTIGGANQQFIYEIAWTANVSKVSWASTSDRTVRFQPGVAALLIRLSVLLRGVIYRRWTELVARINGLDRIDLEGFLFGVERISLKPVADRLLKIQGGKCFYCKLPINGTTHVDHFLPWARHPDNSIANLVASHDACNLEKSAYLAASRHVSKWRERMEMMNDALLEIADSTGWDLGTLPALGAARALYHWTPGTAQLWIEKKKLISLQAERPAIEALLNS